MKLPAAPLPERPAADGKPAAPGSPLPAPPDALFAALLNLITARTAPAEGQTPASPVAKDGGVPTSKAPAADLAATLMPALPPVAAPAVKDVAPPAEPGAKKPAHGKAAAAVGVELPVKPATPAKAADAAPPLKPPAAAPAPVAVAEPAKPARPEPVRAEPAPQADRTSLKALVPKEVAPPKERAAVDPRPVLRAERIEALVRVATRQGVAEARMELHPQELGSVVVKLRVTSDGLNATFTASNADAIPQLQQAGEDLRRSLEARGLTLATLDVRAETGQASERREQRGWGRSKERRAVEEIDDDSTTVTTSIPVGELVDVHA
jgi:flagellar hook-length control protein FliK